MDEAKPGEEGLRTFIQVVLSEEEDSDEIKLSLAIVSCAEEKRWLISSTHFMASFTRC